MIQLALDIRALEGFKFKKRDSLIHNLDPRTKLFIVVTLLALSLSLFDLMPLLFFLLLSLLLALLSKSFKEWIKMLKSTIIFSLLIFILNFLFTTVQDRLTYAVVMSLRFIVVVGIFSIFFLTTSPDELADALVTLKVPYEYVLIFTMALRFVPTLARDLQIIYDAYRSRGLEIDRGNFLERIKNLKPLLITLFVLEIRRSFMVAEALESRAFNARLKRTFYFQPKIGKNDIIAIILTCLLIIAFIIWRYFLK